MLRLIHTADWQIGKPYGRVSDPQKRYRLQEERLQVIERIGAAARQGGAHLVLVAGDLFDSPTVAPPVVLAVLAAIGRLDIPVLAIPGNHDHGAPGTVWHQEGFERERLRRAPNLRLLLRREPFELEDLVVLPCPLLRVAESDDPTAWIRDLDLRALPAEKPRVVLAHGSVHGFGPRDYDAAADSPPGGHNRLELGSLPLDAIDYIALGDWHNLKAVSAKAWYPGTPEPDRFDQGENELRGQVLQVDLARGLPPQVETIPTGRLRWHSLRAQLREEGDLVRLEQQVQALIHDRIGEDLLRLELGGCLSLAAHERYASWCEGLEHQLLDLRLRGSCEAEPQEEELSALTSRPGDPLIARVAADLRQRLVQQEEESDDAESARIARLALCELHRLVNEA